jgi:hypothetical protein
MDEWFAAREAEYLPQGTKLQRWEMMLTIILILLR